MSILQHIIHRLSFFFKSSGSFCSDFRNAKVVLPDVCNSDSGFHFLVWQAYLNMLLYMHHTTFHVCRINTKSAIIGTTI